MNYLALTAVTLTLIVELGSPSFRRREAAHAKLAAMLPVAHEFLTITQSHKDAEIAARSVDLLQVRKQWQANHVDRLLPQGMPVFPWIDSLPEGYPDRQAIIEAYLPDHPGNIRISDKWPVFIHYRKATQRYCQDLLYIGWSENQVRELLLEMRRGDLRWLQRNNVTEATAWEQAKQ